MKIRRKKYHFNVFNVVMLVILLVYAFSMVFLLCWAFISSFKSKTDFNIYPLEWPKGFHFENYTNIFKDLNVPITVVGVGQRKMYLFELFWNSIVYTVGCTFVDILAKAAVAYVVARYKFRFGKFLYSMNLVIMILPIIGALPSELRMMRLLGFYDNVFALMLMKGSYTGMNFMIFHATFASIEKDYTEAATIDGASHVAIMFKIIFPMAKQIITILALTSMITYWNDWNVSVTYLPSWPTASYALFVFQNSNLPEIALGGIPYIFCACTVVMLPLLVIFIVFREQLMGEISFGGVKG